MKKQIWIGIGVIVVLFLGIGTMMFLNEKNALPRERDREFRKGTCIWLEQVSDVQVQSLYKLCKVWGYVKYRHPSIVDGTINWDAELFRVLPEVLNAKSVDETNTVLFSWLAQFSFEIPEQNEEVKNWLAMQKENGQKSLDTEWILDTEFLGKELSAYLEKLSQVYIVDKTNGYASFDPERGVVQFDNEQDISFSVKDTGVKLLALFRFWNIYEYYSPNVEITKVDWDQVLRKGIPQMIEAEDMREYTLAIAEVTAATGDAHLTISDPQAAVLWYYGKYQLPCSFQVIDGKIVVNKAKDTSDDERKKILPGDIIETIDGIAISERVEVLSRYMAIPEADKLANQFSYPLLRSEKMVADVEVNRQGKKVNLKIETTRESPVFENPYKTGLLHDGRVGYIDPSALEEGDLQKLMKEFEGTEGIIVDLRKYPTQFIPYLMGEYIIPEPTVFARLTFPNQVIPGDYIYSGDFQSGAGVMDQSYEDAGEYPMYRGKIAILMDETSQSASEFAIMALRQAPNGVVIGTNSIGADGDIVRLRLPGNIQMAISGLGVYTPEGGQTQRVGLEPDIECRTTIEGLTEERDELVEKALEVIEE